MRDCAWKGLAPEATATVETLNYDEGAGRTLGTERNSNFD
jgi:hypothetical protein